MNEMRNESARKETSTVRRSKRDIGRLHAIKLALPLLVLGVLLPGSPARASTPVSTEDLQATVRSLGFLESPARDDFRTIAIVYDGTSGGLDGANATAAAFNALPKPSSFDLKAETISAEQLSETSRKPMVVYLMPDLSSSKTIAALVQKLHLLSISNNPACLDTKSCVLMVHTEGGVEIVLDTSLAAAVGARFSSIFSMMVKLK